MLSRVVLVATQLVVGWLATEPLLRLLPPFGALRMAAYAVVAAVLVWSVGLLLSQILRDTGTPSTATLGACLILALAGVGLVYFREDLPLTVRNATRSLREEIYPLLGAVLGY